MATQLSIVTVNYNNLDGLILTTRSILSQLFKNFDWYIVDGGSTDGSLEYIQSISDSRLNYISEKDKGIYDAQNKGIQNTKGEYLLFLNSGDYFYATNSLEEIFNQNPKEEFLYFDLYMDSKIIQYPKKLDYLFFFTNIINHQSQIIHRSLFAKYGLYSLDYPFSADYDFLLRIFKNFQISYQYFPIILSVYDTNGVTSTKENLNLIHKEKNEIRQKNIPYEILKPLQEYVLLEKNYLLLKNAWTTRFIHKLGSLFKF